jgi:Holliday junction resolvase
MQYVGKSMRYANRIDENQNEIVKALRKAGAYVRIISQGDGIPDLLVAYKGYTILMEVKDGDKPPSARKLTEAEQKFFDEWTGGMLVVVNSVEESVATLQKCD